MAQQPLSARGRVCNRPVLGLKVVDHHGLIEPQLDPPVGDTADARERGWCLIDGGDDPRSRYDRTRRIGHDPRLRWCSPDFARVNTPVSVRVWDCDTLERFIDNVLILKGSV